ncbi:MAG: 4Fe-4S dicluster domain-containing protein [Firmicutes bacterium]|nr:4Fe-4S dicluster domain-containing protein [Bacillota bacterium]MDH7496049.1 4Fe-4S dicluster domain-containing protein [Bacillota bacterium]
MEVGAGVGVQVGGNDMDIRSFDPAKCTGCRNCELACSIGHFGVFNPRRARIHVLRRGSGEEIRVCDHCEEHPCTAACKRRALEWDDGEVFVNEAACNLCGDCVASCPSGGISVFDGSVLICDLCHGDPMCVRFCTTGALALRAR